MDSYQQSLIVDFFSTSSASQSSCHQFIQNNLAPLLLAAPPAPAIAITPSPYQGSLSYTCIVTATNLPDTVVQFRHDEIDIYGNKEAHRLLGPIVPLLSSRGVYRDLFVYTSPLAPAKPYIELLMTFKPELSLENQLTTVTNLAEIMVHNSLRPPPDSNSQDATIPDLVCKLKELPFNSSTTKDRVFRCISEIQTHRSLLSSLPLALTHQDLTPFNYLVDAHNGRITAVLDWDGASYLPLGRNFHFVENLLGFMTKTGWEDYSHRRELEKCFYTRVSELLVAQGYRKFNFQAVEFSKAVGVLEYFVGRFGVWGGDGRAEMYLEGYLRNFSWEM